MVEGMTRKIENSKSVAGNKNGWLRPGKIKLQPAVIRRRKIDKTLHLRPHKIFLSLNRHIQSNATVYIACPCPLSGDVWPTTFQIHSVPPASPKLVPSFAFAVSRSEAPTAFGRVKRKTCLRTSCSPINLAQHCCHWGACAGEADGAPF